MCLPILAAIVDDLGQDLLRLPLHVSHGKDRGDYCDDDNGGIDDFVFFAFGAWANASESRKTKRNQCVLTIDFLLHDGTNDDD